MKEARRLLRAGFPEPPCSRSARLYAGSRERALQFGCSSGRRLLLLGVLPGPGGVFVRTTQGKYRPACVDPKKFFKVKDSPDPKGQRMPLYGDTDTINTAVGEGWGGMPQSQFSAIVLVDPAENSGPIFGRSYPRERSRARGACDRSGRGGADRTWWPKGGCRIAPFQVL